MDAKILLTSYHDLKYFLEKRNHLSSSHSWNNSKVIYSGRIIDNTIPLTNKNIVLIVNAIITLGDKFSVILDDTSLYFFSTIFPLVYNFIKCSHTVNSEEKGFLLKKFLPSLSDFSDCLILNEAFDTFFLLLKNISDLDEKFGCSFINFFIESFSLFSETENENDKLDIIFNILDRFECERSIDSSDFSFLHFTYYMISHFLDTFPGISTVFSKSKIFEEKDNVFAINTTKYGIENLFCLSEVFENLKMSIQTISQHDIDSLQIFIALPHESLRLHEKNCLENKIIVICCISLADVPIPLKINNISIIFAKKEKVYLSLRDFGLTNDKYDLKKSEEKIMSTIMIYDDKFEIKGINSCKTSYTITKFSQCFNVDKSLKYEKSLHTTSEKWIFVEGIGYYNSNHGLILFKKDIRRLNPKKSDELF